MRRRLSGGPWAAFIVSVFVSPPYTRPAPVRSAGLRQRQGAGGAPLCRHRPYPPMTRLACSPRHRTVRAPGCAAARSSRCSGLRGCGDVRQRTRSGPQRAPYSPCGSETGHRSRGHGRVGGRDGPPSGSGTRCHRAVHLEAAGRGPEPAVGARVVTATPRPGTPGHPGACDETAPPVCRGDGAHGSAHRDHLGPLGSHAASVGGALCAPAGPRGVGRGYALPLALVGP